MSTATTTDSLHSASEGVWGGPRRAAGVLAVLVIAAGAVAWHVAPATFPSSMRLDSGWLFHAAVSVGAFLALFLVAAVVSLTVRHGGPPPKLNHRRVRLGGDGRTGACRRR